MAEMRELVTVEQAERAIRMVAVALPVAGAAAGAIAGAVRGRAARGLAVGLLCGLAGPAIWLLWRMYNGVVGGYGLDSVRGLLVNLGLFVAIGLVIGVAVGLVWRRLSKQAA
ncbi:MAG: hypothetical protein MUQ26_07735 [Armatimonadetes bacterium]|nr:hypothetical protein [Armatimonadota bacterium]